MTKPKPSEAVAVRPRTVADDRPVRLWRWQAPGQGTDNGTLAAGDRWGTQVTPEGVVIAAATGVRRYRDPHGDGTARDYAYASWTSPVVAADFAATEVLVWWQATTPPGAWLEVSFRPRRQDGTHGPWYVMGCWAAHDTEVHPTTVGGQNDGSGMVKTDEYLVDGEDPAAVAAGQVRVTLYRPVDSSVTPTVHTVGVTFSRNARRMLDVSPPGPSVGRRLAVPAYSQRLHANCHTHWNGGGNSWCSPTSTVMVLAYFDKLPAAEDRTWVAPGCVNPVVPHAVRGCFDYGYDGAGNWTFNTAYPPPQDVSAFVTRLRSVAEIEQFIAAGIPLVASVRVKAGELAGAGYDSAGHLLVVTGTTKTGDVVVNDPAGSDDADVPRVYDRRQFEAAWLATSGGVVYVIHPRDTPLPTPPAQPNW